MRSIAVLLAICFFGSALSCQTRHGSPALRSLRDLNTYVGTYPCRNGLLKTRVLRQAIMSTLGSDSSSYAEHIAQSGCGQIEKQQDLIVMDMSQVHVGGYSSLIFVKPSGGAVWLYWLDAPVAPGAPSRIYGSRPVPASVLNAIEQRMNEGWGHVAHFRVDADSIVIERKL